MTLEGLWNEQNKMILLAIIFLAPLIIPILSFFIFGWASKRQEIVNYFDTPEKIIAYFAKFPFNSLKDTNDTSYKLNQLYASLLGRSSYVLPLLLLISVSGTLAFLLAQEILSQLSRATSSTIVTSAVWSAIAGAYAWIASDATFQFWQKSLLPTHLYQYSIRFIVAVPLGYSFATFVTDAGSSKAAFLAFAVGAFPLTKFLSLTRRFITRQFELLGAKIDGPLNDDAITKLQGIDDKIADRLHQEGIFTISQLPTADPVRLAVRTNLDFGFIIDCASQALAWIYLNDKLNLIRVLGLRGGFEIKTLMEAFDYDPSNPELGASSASRPKRTIIQDSKSWSFDADAADLTIGAAAAMVNVPKEQMERTFYEIACDPYTTFLTDLWH